MPYDHGYHTGFWFFGLFPFLMFLVLVGVGIWAVLRFSSRPSSPPQSWPRPDAQAPRDPALEELRVRYARGELDREEFLQRSRDLGGGDAPTPPDGGPTPAG